MSLDATERWLIRIVIGCCFGIVYLLRIKYYGDDTTNVAANHSELFQKDPISTADHTTRGYPPPRSPNENSLPSNNEWIYHKQKVHFVHSAMKMKPVAQRETRAGDTAISEAERHGLFASDNIPFGTILSIEHPIFSVPQLVLEDKSSFNHFFERLPYIDGAVRNLMENDAEFERIWKNLPMNLVQWKRLSMQLRAHKKVDHRSMVDNFVRFATNKIPAHKRWAVYSVIGRVGFGLPQNAMVVISGKDKGYKALLIATRQIEKGEEIVTDHFLDWTVADIMKPDHLIEREMMCNDREFDLNKKLMALLKRYHSASSLEQKHEILSELYPNGMIGKDSEQKFAVIPGCKGMNRRKCIMKVGLMEAIGSGAVFEDRFDQRDYVGTLDVDQCPDGVASCDGMQLMDYLPRAQRLIVHRNRNEFHHDPNSVNDRRLMPHPAHTKFVHSALRLKYFGDEKQYGLITTKRVPFGSVLIVEWPMLRIEDDPNEQSKDSMDDLQSLMYGVAENVSKMKEIDHYFKRIWNEELKANKRIFTSWLFMLIEHKRKIPSDQVLADWAKFNTFWFGGANGWKPKAIYSILSRINYGLPQNVAAIFGEETDDFVCVLVATRNLKEGEELQIDYLQNLHTKDALSKSQEWVRENRGPEFGFKWTDDLKTIVQMLHSDALSKKEKRTLIEARLYSNGVIGKRSFDKFRIIDGCDWLTATDCDTKKAMKRDIGNGELFRIIREQSPATQSPWMGQEFVELSLTWNSK